MGNLSGCISAKLADRDESYEKSLVDEINRTVNPPRPVSPDEVHIRAMYIVSDQVNSQGGRFADEELKRLSELLIDSPVMVGHRRDSLPVARNFKAVRLEVDGRTWIKSYFYWMKDSIGAEDLRKNIDGGIYKECSISFLYTKPECSICGEDIRGCPHAPFHEYDVGTGKEIAHFVYRGIIRVLETSLVFRGAVPDTRITDRLTPDEDEDGNGNVDVVPALHTFEITETSGSGIDSSGYIEAPVMFFPAEKFSPDGLVTAIHTIPHQPGLALRIKRNGERIDLETSMLLPDNIRARVIDLVRQSTAKSFVADAALYASRGKDRQNGAGLMQVIQSEANTHRLRLRICDVREINGALCSSEPYEDRCRKLTRLFNERSVSGVTSIHPRHYDPKDAGVGSLSALSRKYNFGIEAVCERADGSLSRYILNPEHLVPASVDAILSRERNRISATVSRMGYENETKTLIGPPMAGVEKGSVVLACCDEPKKSPGRRAWRLFDVVPGGESLRILVSDERADRNAKRLEIRRSGTSMHMVFAVDDDLMEATVHHFSTPLFSRRRKFIADVRESDLFGKDKPVFQVLPVQGITRTGKLIRISLSTLSKLFGNASVLWFRPVLIDGEERHLFYAGEVSGPPGEG